MPVIVLLPVISAATLSLTLVAIVKLLLKFRQWRVMTDLDWNSVG
jgi:hypothetical protein